MAFWVRVRVCNALHECPCLATAGVLVRQQARGYQKTQCTRFGVYVCHAPAPQNHTSARALAQRSPVA